MCLSCLQISQFIEYMSLFLSSYYFVKYSLVPLISLLLGLQKYEVGLCFCPSYLRMCFFNFSFSVVQIYLQVSLFFMLCYLHSTTEFPQPFFILQLLYFSVLKFLFNLCYIFYFFNEIFFIFFNVFVLFTFLKLWLKHVYNG